MLRQIEPILIGSADSVDLEHRCYNGVCLVAGIGCLVTSGLNAALGLPLPTTIISVIVGLIFVWLYLDSRRRDAYKPVMWLYILNGLALLAMTWFYNGGVGGSGTFVSMVALVAMSVVF